MFLGSFRTSFSGNNRILFPRTFRKELGNDSIIILMKGFDGEVWGFSKIIWEKEADKKLEIPLTEKEGRALRRTFFSQAAECELDNQGRFIIPSFLKDFAVLKKEVMLIGAGDHFEIWDPGLWEKMSSV